MREVISLSAYGQLVELVPSLGAATARYACEYQGEWHEFLRRATPAAIEEGDISAMSNFLMAPWAGRIQHGRFTYAGKNIYYPSRLPQQPHSMHGFVRDMPWMVVAQTHESIELLFKHQADEEWPFSFEIRQSYQLSEKGLTICMEAKNTGIETMPFSMGYHPFFPLDTQKDKPVKLYANVQKAWFSDEALMPTHLAPHPMVERLAQGYSVTESEWDTIFTDWEREAMIEWSNRRLHYRVSEPMNFFVLYNPSGESWFCAEPFANITDSFNLRGKFPPQDIGGLDIAPSEKVTAIFELMPSFQ